MKRYFFSLSVGLMMCAAMCVSCSDDDNNGSKTGAQEDDMEKAYVETQAVDVNGHIAVPSKYEAMNGLNNDFSWRIYSYIAPKEAGNSDNMLLSPYSLAVDLAMLSNGADGETLNELKEFLAFGDYSTDEINDYFAVLTRGLAQVDPATTFLSANALWHSDDISVKKAFSSTLESWYKAEIHAATMRTESTLDEINNWANSNTNGMIDKFFENVGTIPDVAALLNAVYLKAAWTHPFTESMTTDGSFNTANGETAETKYFAGRNEQAVFLPFGQYQRFDMFFILPNETATMASVISEMEESWGELAGNATQKNVRISLPKFSAEYVSTWNDCMTAMGCSKIFSPESADFSSFSSSGDIYIDVVKQKAKLVLDENGVECAAATGSSELSSGGEEAKAISLTFNRPFLFGLREASTGVILFMGCVNNAAAE